jgi:hypothetical protein
VALSFAGGYRVLRGVAEGAYSSSWLPAPNGPFYVIMRIYQPKPEVVSGAWKSPPLQKVN